MSDIKIRLEREADHEAIRCLTEAAFRGLPYAGGDEHEILDRLRASGAVALSLVASDSEELVGQVTFSPSHLTDGSAPWFALGPVAVIPSRQREGIGSALIMAGLERIEQMGALGCILTGDGNYYRRFGFEPSPRHAPPQEPAEHFHLKLLGAKRADGRFAFHAAFYGEP